MRGVVMPDRVHPDAYTSFMVTNIELAFASGEYALPKK